MKVEGLLFAFVFVFLWVTDVVYWLTSKDWTGTTAIGFSGGLAFIVSYYLLFTSRRIEPRPEDRGDAEISEGAGEIGFFSPWSWWPIACAAAAAFCGLGLVFKWWMFVIAAPTLILCVIGFLFEYYVGMNKSRAHTHSWVEREMGPSSSDTQIVAGH